MSKGIDYVKKVHQLTQNWYKHAQNYYKSQKQNFEKMLFEQNIIFKNDFISILNEQLQNELNNDENNQEQAMYDTIDKYLVDYIDASINFDKNYNNADLDKISQKYNEATYKVADNHKKFKNQVYKFADNYIQHIFQGMRKQEIIKTIFPEGNFSQSTINLFYGYIKQLFLTRYIGTDFKININNFIQPLKGYFNEAKAYSALINTIQNKEKINITDVSLQRINGRTSLDDILISLKKNIEAEGTSNYDLEDNFGIQVKSWGLDHFPDYINNSTVSKGRMEFSMQTSLLPKTNSWHEGVYNVMTELIDVIGRNNVLYINNNEAIWTYELLHQLQLNNYLLGFYKRKTDDKIEDPHVYALKHICTPL